MPLPSRPRPALALAALVLAAPLAHADLLLAISEGTSGGGAAITDAQMSAKYRPMLEVMERVLKQKVAVRYVRDFRQLESGMKDNQFDLVLARPSDYPARGVRNYGYSTVTTTQPDGHCLLIVKADSPFKTLADLKGKRVIMPEQESYMTKFCMAELRDRNITIAPENVNYVREQGAIPFAIQNGLSHFGGIASYSGTASRLDKENLRVIRISAPQPYLPLIASRQISPQQVQSLGDELAKLPQTAQGREALSAIGIEGFDTGTQPRLLSLLNWLGDKN